LDLLEHKVPKEIKDFKESKERTVTEDVSEKKDTEETSVKLD